MDGVPRCATGMCPLVRVRGAWDLANDICPVVCRNPGASAYVVGGQALVIVPESVSRTYAQQFRFQMKLAPESSILPLGFHAAGACMHASPEGIVFQEDVLVMLPTHFQESAVLRSCSGDGGPWEVLPRFHDADHAAGYAVAAVNHFCDLVSAIVETGVSPKYEAKFEAFLNVEKEEIRFLLYHDHSCPTCQREAPLKVEKLAAHGYLRSREEGVCFRCVHGKSVETSEKISYRVGDQTGHLAFWHTEFPDDDNFFRVSPDQFELPIELWKSDLPEFSKLMTFDSNARRCRPNVDPVQHFTADVNELRGLALKVALTDKLLEHHKTSATEVCSSLDCTRYQCLPSGSVQRYEAIVHVMHEGERCQHDLDIVGERSRLKRALKDLIKEQYQRGVKGADGTCLGNPRVFAVEVVFKPLEDSTLPNSKFFSAHKKDREAREASPETSGVTGQESDLLVPPTYQTHLPDTSNPMEPMHVTSHYYEEDPEQLQ